MPGNSSKKKPIEQYEHKDKERLNNPPAGLVTPETDPETKKGRTEIPASRYQYDPHLDPQLQWAGKAERTLDKTDQDKIEKYKIEILGFDYYNTKTGTIESGGKDKIAMWMLDTDYDGRSLFPLQVFFPMVADNEDRSKLTRNLKAEIDEELIESYRGTISLPFIAGKYKRAAVKIVDDRGVESLKIVEVE